MNFLKIIDMVSNNELYNETLQGPQISDIGLPR